MPCHVLTYSRERSIQQTFQKNFLPSIDLGHPAFIFALALLGLHCRNALRILLTISKLNLRQNKDYSAKRFTVYCVEEELGRERLRHHRQPHYCARVTYSLSQTTWILYVTYIHTYLSQNLFLFPKNPQDFAPNKQQLLLIHSASWCTRQYYPQFSCPSASTFRDVATVLHHKPQQLAARRSTDDPISLTHLTSRDRYIHTSSVGTCIPTYSSNVANCLIDHSTRPCRSAVPEGDHLPRVSEYSSVLLRPNRTSTSSQHLETRCSVH